MTDKAGEREQFETAYARINHSSPDSGWNDAEFGSGIYCEQDVQDAWILWRACAALKAQPAPTEEPDLEDFPALMKDHNVRQLVNDLRDIAIAFHAAGQLRARISGAVGQFLDKHGMRAATTEAQGEDSARLDAPQYRPIGMTIGNDKVHGWHIALDPGENWQNVGHHKRVYVRIDRARASAETGGVKS